MPRKPPSVPEAAQRVHEQARRLREEAQRARDEALGAAGRLGEPAGARFRAGEEDWDAPGRVRVEPGTWLDGLARAARLGRLGAHAGPEPRTRLDRTA